MANAHKGEVDLEVGGRTYRLVMSWNAIAELEELRDQSINRIVKMMEDAENVRLGLLRDVLWAALREHQPDITIQEAGRIGTEAGAPAVMEAIRTAFERAFPSVEESGGNPRKAKG